MPQEIQSESNGFINKEKGGGSRGGSLSPLTDRGRAVRLVFAVLLNVGMMFLLYSLFDPVFDGNDDITIVQFANGACGSFDPHLVYQNYLMGIVLSTLYRLWPAMPWYSWMQFWALCASFTAITYVLCCRVRLGSGLALSLLVQSFAAYECYTNLQYTKTAGVLAAAGMMLLWNGLQGREERDGSLLRGSVLGGILLCVWSILYRYAQFAACSVLTAGIPLLMLLDTRGGGRREQEGGKGWKPFLGIFLRCAAAWALLGVLTAGLVLFDRSMYLRDPQWKKFLEYNEARSELMDYGMTKYEEHGDLYAELGISRTAYDLFDTWNSGDTDVFSTEVMRRLAQAREVKKPGIDTAKAFVKEVPRKFWKNRLFRCLVTAAALWLLFGRHDRRAVFALLFEGLLFLALYYYLFLKGRYLYSRVDAGLWMSVLLVLLWTMKSSLSGGRHIKSLPVNLLRTALILGVMAVCVFVQIPGWKGRLASHNVESRDKRAHTRTLMREISEDEDHLYVSKLGILSASRFSAPFEPMPRGILSNVVILGGWKVESVPYVAVLHRHGFQNNPYEAIAGTSPNADGVRLLDEEIDATIAYLREYYNPDAEAVEAGKWNGKTVWKVVSEP